MVSRVLTAAVWVPIHVAIVVWGRPYHFAIYAAAITAVGLLELFALQRARGQAPFRLLVIASALAYLTAITSAPALAPAVAVVFLLTTLLGLVLRGTRDGALADGGATLFAFAYVPVTLGFLIWIKSWPAGTAALLVFFITLWTVDVAAYLTGKSLGRRRLAPKISPNKTVAGTIGGVVAGVVVAPCLTHFAFPGLGIPWWLAAGLGFLLALSGLIGDLAESILKRDAGAKDSGTILPGHGGVLDRFDAVFFSAPVYCGVLFFLGKAG